MLIDISYTIGKDTIIYPGNPIYDMERVLDLEKGDSANVSRITLGSHTGTHIDAPAHFIEGGTTVDQIPLENMNGRAQVIDATGRSEIDVDFLMEIAPVGMDILLFKTENSLVWSCESILDDYVTLTYDAADYLADRRVKLVGIDYLTIEKPRRKRVKGKSIHRSLLGNDVLICEALNLKNIKAGPYEFFCIPICIEGADGCPVRCVLKET